MNYEWLASFTVFADVMNFTHAARTLHLTQPALHARIAKLGESVARPLYVRRGRVLVLTAEGRSLAAFGREVRAREAQLLSELSGARSSGPVVLAAGRGAFLHLLGNAVRSFPKSKWALRLLTLNAPQTVSAVSDAVAALGVAALDNVPPELEATPLCTVGQRVIMPRAHRLAAKRRIRPADLDGEAIVVAPAGSPHRTMIAGALASASVTWQVAVETTGWDLMIEFARQGMGIAIVNDFCAVPAGMIARPLTRVAPAHYYVLQRAGVLPEQARALKDSIVDSVRARRR